LILNKKSAYIFPAFINEYPENPFSGSAELADRFYDLLNDAASLADHELNQFDFISNHFLQDELKTQYLTYIFSCAVADILNKKKLNPDYGAGYSMGIYAALVHSKVLTFADGLKLIKNAFETIRSIAGDKTYGMCSIIGLSREDIRSLLTSRNFRVDISNQNSGFAFVLSGLYDDIQDLMKDATAEGALHTYLLNVSLPYHSVFLRETRPFFTKFLEKLHFNHPQTKLISLVDQKILYHPEEIKEELTRNLFTPLNWYQTQLELQRIGVGLFVECGLGKNLAKNSKFIDGEYEFLSLSGLIKSKEHG
jgi:[acyl-carrier-protein] S-malonyltransferase